MSALKADVSQQALVLPALLSQMLWFCRAALLQKMLGQHFRDANLLRRAFVHPTLESRPERLVRATARHTRPTAQNLVVWFNLGCVWRLDV